MRSSTTTTSGAMPAGSRPAGEIGIFNRSHYEEVLVVRVHPELLDREKLPPAAKGEPRLETALPRDQRLGALPRRQRHPRRQAVPQPVAGGAADPLPAPDRPAGEELEVLGERRARAPLLGRLPAGVLGDAHPHEHRLGALARHPGRPQVVRPHRRLGGDRERADRARPPLPGGRRDGARASSPR